MNQPPAFNGLEIATPVLSAGGSQVKISAQGIEIITGGKFEAKSGQHQFLGGEKVNYELPKLANRPKEFSHKFKLVDNRQNILPQTRYCIVMQNGELIQGVSDQQGYTQRVYTAQAEEVRIYVGAEAEQIIKKIG